MIFCMTDESINGNGRKEIINLSALECGDKVQDLEGELGVVIRIGCDSVRVKYPDGREWDRSHLYYVELRDVVNYIQGKETELKSAKQLLGYNLMEVMA